MTLPGFWEKFGPDDARAVLALLLLVLAGTLWILNKDMAAGTVFTAFATLAGQYYYSKGE